MVMSTIREDLKIRIFGFVALGFNTWSPKLKNPNEPQDFREFGGANAPGLA